MRVKCHAKCSIAYHTDCWKRHKKDKIAASDKVCCLVDYKALTNHIKWFLVITVMYYFLPKPFNCEMALIKECLLLYCAQISP